MKTVNDWLSDRKVHQKNLKAVYNTKHVIYKIDTFHYFLDQNCRRPGKPAYGSVLSKNWNQILFNSGEKVWFRCDDGYYLDGRKYVVCQENGNWQPQPFPRCVRQSKKFR